MTNKAIYIEMEGCGQCVAVKPLFESECKRLGLPLTVKDAEAKDTAEIGKIRHLPYAIVLYNGKTIKGNAWDVIDQMKEENR